MYKSAVDAWFHFYRYHTGEEYVFDGKDGAHLKQLLKKIETKLKQKGFEVNEETVIATLKGLLNSLKNDRWILDHLELSIVNSKFNVIYSKAIKSNPFTAGDRIDDIIEKRNRERTG